MTPRHATYPRSERETRKLAIANRWRVSCAQEVTSVNVQQVWRMDGPTSKLHCATIINLTREGEFHGGRYICDTLVAAAVRGWGDRKSRNSIPHLYSMLPYRGAGRNWCVSTFLPSSTSLPSPSPPLPSLTPLLPFPSPPLSFLLPPLSYPFPSLPPLPLEVAPLNQLAGLGSAVSSLSGVRGRAPAENEFGAL